MYYDCDMHACTHTHQALCYYKISVECEPRYNGGHFPVYEDHAERIGSERIIEGYVVNGVKGDRHRQ